MLTLDAKFLGAYLKEDKTFEIARTSHALLVINFDANEHLSNELKNAGISTDAGNYKQIVALSTDNFVMPNYGVDSLTLGWFGENIKFPGKATTEELTWTVRDFVDIPTADILDVWYKLTYNPHSGQLGRVSQYKTDCYIIPYAVDGIPSGSVYKLEGCYPSRVERGDVDHSGGDYMKILVSLVYDRVVPKFLAKDGANKTFAGGSVTDKIKVPADMITSGTAAQDTVSPFEVPVP